MTPPTRLSDTEEKKLMKSPRQLIFPSSLLSQAYCRYESVKSQSSLLPEGILVQNQQENPLLPELWDWSLLSLTSISLIAFRLEIWQVKPCNASCNNMLQVSQLSLSILHLPWHLLRCSEAAQRTVMWPTAMHQFPTPCLMFYIPHMI